MYDYDVIVIGAGPGGYPAAIRAAQLGKRVAIIEREKLGGTCLNWGCIPTKTLIAGAERYRTAVGSEEFGVSVKGVKLDYARMVARKGEVVARLVSGIEGLLKSNGVEVIRGTARLEGRDRVSVGLEDGGTRWLRSHTVIVAAGSDSAMPGFLPRSSRVVESRGFLELEELPRSLLILGGGVIGCEFACMAAALGVEVTVVEMLEDILMLLDRDVRRVVRKSMEGLGIKVLTGAALEDIKADKGGVSGRYKEDSLSAEMLLVAVGRKPNTAGLGLEQAGVEVDSRGMIPVDSQGRTSVASIFAIGDLVSGSIQLAHAATQQGVVAAEAAAGLRSKFEKLCPSCIFTVPEIGQVGLTEAQAKSEGREVRSVSFPFMALGKALAAGTPEGFVKWVCDPESGQVLGAQVVGSHATELIDAATLAVRNELTVAEVGNTIHCHPTLSEAWMEAAHLFHGSCIHLPKRPVRR